MCAINPAQKKRILFDFYTSNTKYSKETFEAIILQWCFEQEQKLNQFGTIRLHVKETDQQAD